MPFLDNDGVTRLTTDYLDVFARKEDAVLDPSGGLIRTDDGISVDSLTRESDGTISGSIVELTAEGHAEQFSTTGKNLARTTFGNTTEGDLAFTKLGDFCVRASGSTGSNHISYGTNNNFTLVAGTYTFSMAVEGTSNGAIYPRLYKNSAYGDALTNVSDAADSFSLTFTLDDTTGIWCTFGVVKNKTVDCIVRIQLEAGSIATEYEPYTGGAPSPSPDYPQEIQVVRGRNLLPNNATSQTINGVTFTVNDDGSVTANGTATANAYFRINNNVDIVAGTYMLSGCPTGGGSSKYILYTQSSSGTNTNSDSGSGKAILYDGSYTMQVVISVHNGYTCNNLTFYPQLELGSTPQPYVPYGHVGMEVHGKNLFDMSKVGANAIITETNVHSPYTSATWWNVFTGTTGLGTKIDDLSKIMLLQAGTYTISGVREGGLFVGKVDDDGTYANDQAHIITMNTLPITFTIASPTYVTVLTSISITDFQIELGSTATEYEPYYHSTTSIPLPSRGWVAGLSDGTADTLRLDGAGKVEWTLNTNEVVLDGSSDERWYSQNDGNLSYIRTSIFSNVMRKPETSAIVAAMLASHFNVISWNDVTYNRIGLGLAAGGAFGYAHTGEMVTVADEVAWLAENPVTVLYPLATPVTEDCGYVDLPDIPSDVTVSIPELDALGVKYFVDDSAWTLARQWYERADESDASIDQRIELVESNIATIESTTAQSNHAVNSYFMLDNVLRKATSAIASGETISNSNSSPITVEQVITTLNNSVAALGKEVVFAITPRVSHRNIYRGKNLGTALTTAQKAQIAAGTFDDLYVGDYWTINSRVYRIADIDYYYNVGDTAFTKHHLVIVPDASFGNSAMNDSDTTAGAYVGSKMYTSSDSILNTARTTISNDFGNSLASHREYLANAVDSSGAQSAAWYDSTVELMNEIMVYGCFIHAKPTSNAGYLYTIDKAQLALFRLNPAMVNLRYDYWLRDVVLSLYFASVNYSGRANYTVASSTGGGVRPFFCIVGD